MAAASGVAAASVSYNQPMLGVMVKDMGSLAALVPTATSTGFSLGIFFLLPLSDITDRRRLIVTQLLALAVALALAASAPSVVVLIAASLVMGASACAAHQIVPFAASLAPLARRGAVVGSVMSGLLCGLLLSRAVAGLVASHFGWRAMFWIAIPLVLAAAGLMAAVLPRTGAAARIPYPQALASMVGLWRDEPSLRRSALTQATMFGSFSVFWTVLALHLQEPAIGVGAGGAGLFGILGAAGVLGAPYAGRLADRLGSRPMILVAVTVLLSSWILLYFWSGVPGLIVGVLGLDVGVQMSMIANQHVVYGLRPEARSRVNTVYMTVMFLGGAFGSFGGMAIWRAADWRAVCLFSVALGLAAVVVQAPWRRPQMVPAGSI
jgi:predicted MFS family arabinose efflux permease